MFVLLACIPTALGAVLFVLSYKDVLSGSREDPPSGWQWKLAGPVVVATAAPLSLAAREAHAEEEIRWLLMPNIALLFFLVLLFAGSRAGDFDRLFKKVRLGKMLAQKVRVHHLVLWTGLALIVSASAATISATLVSNG